ncbi:MAG: putative metallopeptidase [Dehalococcoidia bacterium]
MTATVHANGHTATITPDAISGHVTSNPTHRPYVPPDESFPADDDYLASKELTTIGDALVARWPELQFLEEVEVTYLWKRKGGKSKGKAVLGTCVKPAGLVKHFGQCQFVIWIAADHVRDMGLTNLQLEALVFHELNHCGWEIDENESSPTFGETKYILKPHDDEVFWAELQRYGAWNEQRQVSARVYQQLALGG